MSIPLAKRDHIKRTIVVCATPRSGSTLFYDVMAQMGQFHAHSEHFEPKEMRKFFQNGSNDGSNDGPNRTTQDWVRFVQEKRTVEGSFPVKIMYSDLERLLQSLQAEKKELRESELLNFIFPNVQFVYVWRRNLVRQAISWYRASRTNRWQKKTFGPGPSSDPKPDPVYNGQEIFNLYRELERQNRSWEDFFVRNGVTPIPIAFEDFIGDPLTRIPETITKLGGTWHRNQTEIRYQAMSDSKNLVWEWIFRMHLPILKIDRAFRERRGTVR